MARIFRPNLLIGWPIRLHKSIKFLSPNRTNPNATSSLYQHYNGEEAKKLITEANEDFRSDDANSSRNEDVPGIRPTCIFAKFTQALYSLLTLVPKSTAKMIQSIIPSTSCCCCIPVEHILSTIPLRQGFYHSNYVFLERLTHVCQALIKP